MLRSFSLVLLMLAFTLPFSIFANGQEEAADDELHIVYVTPLIAHPVWLKAKEGFDVAAQDFGFRGDWVGPQGLDVNAMIEQIELAIASKADGIITMGLNPEAMVPVLEQAEEAGIPVVIVNSDVPDAPRLAYLGTDPQNMASVAAQEIMDTMEGEKIIAAGMVAALDYNIGREQTQAYQRTFETHDAGFEWVTTGESRSEQARAVEQWQNIFNTYPDVNVSVSVAAEAGPAAGQVVQEMGLVDDVLVMAIDDVQQTLDMIGNGYIYGTAVQNFFRMGYQPAQWLVEYNEDGSEPPALINDSGTIIVTQENLDTYATDTKKPETWE